MSSWLHDVTSMRQRCSGAGIQSFQQDPEQDQEWIFLIGTGTGAGVILSRVFLTLRCIFAVYINCYTGAKQEQESINFAVSEITPESGVNF